MKLFIMEYWTNIRDKLTRTWTETQQFPSTVNSLFSTRLKHLFSNSASLFIPVCLFFSSLLLFPAFSSFFSPVHCYSHCLLQDAMHINQKPEEENKEPIQGDQQWEGKEEEREGGGKHRVRWRVNSPDDLQIPETSLRV